MFAQHNTRTAGPQSPFDGAGCAVFEGPAAVGPLWMAWAPEGLAILSFGAEPPAEAERRRWWPEGAGAVVERPIPTPVYDGLRRYFSGEDEDPATLPVRLSGTRFQRRVWAALRDVGRGQVRTYAGLAKDAGSPRAMRAVGMAMGANPLAIVVPCHRVVGAGLTLGGYSGGLDKKRALLALEGVAVEGDSVLPGQLDLGSLG